jgi:hypothetical protein
MWYKPNSRCTGNGEPGTLNHDFTQLLLVKNRAGKGYGGAIFTRQTFYCINSTIADNYLEQDLCGGAIACFPWYNSYGSPQAVTPVFFNSILWNNSTGLLPTQNQIYLHADQCNPFFATCDIQNFNSLSVNDFILNGTPNTLTGSAWSPTLINPIILDDPQFVDATNYDYRIDNFPLSLCKNVGTGNLSIPALCLGFGTNYFGFPWTNDIRGNTFIRDIESLIDIGAYEIQGIDPAPPRLAPFSTEADARLEESSFNIMPNPVPVGQIAFLNILCPDSLSAEIEIIDFTGNCIHSAKLTGNGKLAEKVNTQGLSKACYLIRLTFKDKNARMFTRSKKLIIM